MTPIKTAILALALLTAVLTLPATARAAGSKPAPTQTPYPTYTPYPSPTPAATATRVPSPTPTPSPTPAATIGGAISAGNTCGVSGLQIPLPLGNGICIDLWGVIQRTWTAMWSGLTDILTTQIQSFTDAVMGPLTRTDNPTSNSGLAAVKDTLTTDANYGFSVVFAVAVLWVTRPAWFGNVSEGVALLWRSGLVLAALHSYDLLVNIWLGAVNGLASDIGASTMHDLGHSAVALVLALPLVIVVGIERAVSLHVFAFVYEIGPLAIILFAWPPAADIARAWLRSFAYLSLLGPAYALMLSVIVSLQGQGNGKPGGLAGTIIWNDIMLLGGLLVLALVPGILAALLAAASHAGAGSLSQIAAKVGKVAAL